MHVQDASSLLPRTVIPEKAGQRCEEFPALGFWAAEHGLKHAPHERVRLVGRPRSEVWRCLGVPNMERLYPELDAFIAIRRDFDPNGVFLNDHLRPLVG